MRIASLFALGLLACATGVAAQTAGSYIAGLHPYERPEGAPPHPSVDTRTPAQVEQDLHGIIKPVPGNVEEIAATGNWFVPLRHPGLTGPYDLRGWHGTGAAAAAAAAEMPAARNTTSSPAGLPAR